MEKLQTSRLAMYRTLRSFFQSNLELIKGIQAFAELIPAFSDLIDKIEKTGKTQTTIVEDTTAIKHDEKAKMVQSLLRAHSSLRALGREVGDVVLENTTDQTETMLLRARDQELLNIADRALDNVERFTDQLGKYGMPEEGVLQFSKDRQAYYDALHGKDSGRAAQKAAGPKLRAMFKEGNALIDKGLDPMMLLLRKDQPDLYEDYLKARQILFAGIRHRPPSETPAVETPQTDSTATVPPTAPVLQPAADTKQ